MKGNVLKNLINKIKQIIYRKIQKKSRNIYIFTRILGEKDQKFKWLKEKSQKILEKTMKAIKSTLVKNIYICYIT